MPTTMLRATTGVILPLRRLPIRNRNRKGFCNAVFTPEPEVARVLEQASRSLENWQVCHTDFLTPPVLQESLAGVKKLSGIGSVVSGGYSSAERCRLSLGPLEMIRDAHCTPAGFPGAVSALSIGGNFSFDPAGHGDFLGAVLGTGIVREKVGDVLVLDERGAQVLVVPDLVDFFLSSLKQVKTTSVTCREIPLSDLEIPVKSTKAWKTVESSLRLDSVASAGFKLSRSKLADSISKGEVRVNWREAQKSNTTLKVGDVVALDGKGRLEIGEIEVTKKGKYAIMMIRHL